MLGFSRVEARMTWSVRLTKLQAEFAKAALAVYRGVDEVGARQFRVDGLIPVGAKRDS
jgi:hypothetical protein